MAYTVPVWSDENHDLWRRIATHDFGTADAPLDFTTRLAREHGWTLAQARGAIEEYRRFCFLSVVAGHPVTPSDAVDEVWHLHLTYTRDYWDTWCPTVLRARLHHEPTRGGRPEADRHYHQYAQTLATYQQWFGAPPAQWWPHAGGMFAKALPYRRVDLTRHVILPRPRLPSLRQFGFTAAGLALLAVAPLLRAQSGNPLDMTGPEFLGLYFLLMLACIVVAVFMRRTMRNTGGAENAVNLDAWQTAYLVGGSARAVDAGIAELLARDVATIDGDGRFHVDRDTRLEYPLDKIAEQAREPVSLRQLLSRARPGFDALRGKLEQRGFMLTREQALRVAQRSALPFALLGAFGIVKIVIGMERQRPVGLLILLVIITAVITLALLFNRPERTRAGDAVLGQLRVKHAHALRAPRGIDVGLAVALGGTAVLAGTAYAAYHEARNPQSSSGGGDSSSGCSSSDSGGGGDGGGGGGCGGCGGGGGD